MKNLNITRLLALTATERSGAVRRMAAVLLLLLVTTLPASATDFITDVMVAGNKDEDDFNTLIGNLQQQGWTDISQDLNQGCGSGSAYIHLLYKKQSSSGFWGVLGAGTDTFKN